MTRVLQISAHFPPNIGGVETHLSNLVSALIKRDFGVTILTYRPLTTKTSWKLYERNAGFEVLRIPWLPNLFYNLVTFPILEFLYLLPGLFLITPLVILLRNPGIIHAHGLVAGFVAVFWGKIFGKKIIISTHSIYHFPEYSLYREFVKWIFNNADINMGLSDQAVDEIKSLGVPPQKVKKFTYWIDLDKFKVQSSKFKVKRELGWGDKFIVLFVGRLVSEKGVELLLESVKSWDKNIGLKIIGSGPLEKKVKEIASKFPNVDFIEGVEHGNLPLYYSGSDILIVPSIHEEGFGRVILEALACGTPVIGSNRGAIPEALDETVGKLIDVSSESIKQTVHYFYSHRDELKKLAKNCRTFAERRYSEKNAETIIRAYKQ